MDGNYVRQDKLRSRNRFRENSTTVLFNQIVEEQEDKDRKRAVALLRAAASHEPLYRSDEIR